MNIIDKVITKEKETEKLIASTKIRLEEKYETTINNFSKELSSLKEEKEEDFRKKLQRLEKSLDKKEQQLEMQSISIPTKEITSAAKDISKSLIAKWLSKK